MSSSKLSNLDSENPGNGKVSFSSSFSLEGKGEDTMPYFTESFYVDDDPNLKEVLANNTMQNSKQSLSFLYKAVAKKSDLMMKGIANDKSPPIIDITEENYRRPSMLNPIKEGLGLAPKPPAELNELLFYCILGLASYIGALIRVGLEYYQVWKIETNITGIIFANILGSFIMGYFKHCKAKAVLYPSFEKIVFLGITTGLCGSITSFSTWAMESNKSLFLQFDLSWGSISGSYDGGRWFQWIVLLWIGVSIPVAALQLGMYVATKYPIDTMFEHDPSAPLPTKQIYAIYLSFILANVILVFAPIVAAEQDSDYNGSWSFLLFTAVFGWIGTIIRYQLSLKNAATPTFPIGTFYVNIGGTCILAAVTAISKFATDYYNIDAQSILFGIANGFCGCLTTISTFANEINDMALQENVYKYSAGTSLVAQVGIFLIYNIVSYKQVKLEYVMPATINQCSDFENYCSLLLDRVGCPSDQMTNIGCSTKNDYSTYKGDCMCGTFNAGFRISEILIDSQVKRNATASYASVWPAQALSFTDPANTVDYCQTVENMCDHYFNRIGCPNEQRKINSCSRHGIINTKNQCQCTSAIDVTSSRIPFLIVNTMLNRGADLLSEQGYVTQNNTNFCKNWKNACTLMLEHVQCPPVHQKITGCSDIDDYNTWPTSGAQCKCGMWEEGSAVASSVYSAIVGPNQNAIIAATRVNSQSNVWDVCTAYIDVCNFWLDRIGCPSNLRTVISCPDSSSGTVNNGLIQSFNGSCICGGLNELSDMNYYTIIDALLAQDVTLYIPPPQAPFVSVIGSSPFGQLTRWQRPVTPTV